MSIFDSIGDAFKSIGKVTVDGLETVGKGTVGLVTGDSFFPDNDAREARVKELSGDVSQSSYRLAADNEVVKRGLKNLNDTIDSVYRSLGGQPPAIAVPQSVNYHESAYEISQLIAPLVAVKGIDMALTDSAVVTEAEAGEIGGEAAAEALGAAGLEMGPAAVIMAGVIIGLGALQGNEKRDKLQHAIWQLYPLRNRLKNSEVMATKLANGLAGLSPAVTMLGTLGYNELQLTNAIQILISGVEKALQLDVTDQVNTQLASLDTSRGSWTKED